MQSEKAAEEAAKLRSMFEGRLVELSHAVDERLGGMLDGRLQQQHAKQLEAVSNQ